MTDDGKEGKASDKRGFSGLSDLTSDIDEVLRSADRSERRVGSGRHQSPAATAQTQSEPPRVSASSKPRNSTQQRSRAPLKLIAGIAALGIVLWGVSVSYNKEPTNIPATANSDAAEKRSQDATALNFDDIPLENQNNATPAVQDATSVLPSVEKPTKPARPSEERPQVGTGLVLGVAEIRYCLAEDIRMEGAKAATDAYNAADVDRFNSMVHDYNSRCSNFRYRSGDLAIAKGDIEPIRAELLAEGRRKIRPPSAGVKSTGMGSDATPVAVALKNLCKTRPKNGKILKKNIRLVEVGHRLTIENGSSSDAIIKLRDASRGKLAASFYVRKSMSASLNGIPDGRYRVQFAYGDAMARDCSSFIAPTASAFNDVQSLVTETTATQVLTQEMSFTLFTVPDGNVRPVDISVEEFNGD